MGPCSNARRISGRICIIGSYALIATNQTEFTLDALLTRRSGRTRRTRDMAEIYACICGNVVTTLLRTTQELKARTPLCAAGLTDAKHLGYVIRDIYFQFSINLIIFIVSSFILRASITPALRRNGVVSSMNAESVHVWLNRSARQWYDTVRRRRY